MAGLARADRWFQAIQGQPEVMQMATWLGCEISVAERHAKAVVIEGLATGDRQATPGPITIYIDDAGRHPPPESGLPAPVPNEQQRIVICAVCVGGDCKISRGFLPGPAPRSNPLGLFSARFGSAPTGTNRVKILLGPPGGDVTVVYNNRVSAREPASQ